MNRKPLSRLNKTCAVVALVMEIGSRDLVAQEELWRRSSESSTWGSWFGSGLMPFSDVDSNGINDLLVGASQLSCDGTGIGIVYVLEGSRG